MRRLLRLCSASGCTLRLLLVLLATLTATAEGAAQSQPAAATWAVRMAPGSRCTSDSSFLSRFIKQIPEAQRADEQHAELVAEVDIQEGLARIRVFDRVLQAEAGDRELALTARHCVDIADSVALVLGVLVEAGRALGTAAAAQAAPPPDPPPRAPEPREREPVERPLKRPSAPLVRRRPVWRGVPAGHELNAAVGVNFGLVPAPVLGFTLGWGIDPAKSWPIWLQASGWTGAESRDGHATISSFYGGILTCPLSGSASNVRLRACAGVHAGALLATSEDLAQTATKRRPVALAGIELAASIPLIGPLEFAVIARGDGLLTRSRFYYETTAGQKRYLYDPSVVIGGLFAGLSLHLR